MVWTGKARRHDDSALVRQEDLIPLPSAPLHNGFALTPSEPAKMAKAAMARAGQVAGTRDGGIVAANCELRTANCPLHPSPTQTVLSISEGSRVEGRGSRVH